MKRKLLLPIIFSQAINAQAWTTNKKVEEAVGKANSEISSLNQKLQDLCGDSKVFSLEQAGKDSNRLWREIVDQVNNARIKFGFEKSVQLVDRVSVGIDKETISEATSYGKYLGIDKWSLAAGVHLLHTDFGDLGLSGRREVTFIQQFPSRCKSLVRVGYDPITKIPLNSERALTSLQPGDFVAFSSPLTLNLGRSLAQFIKDSEIMKSIGGVNIYATGEFNIHVFRMNNNYVRVRFFAAKTKGVDLNPGIKFFALSGLLKITPLEGEIGMALTNLFSADYVFNLNDPESRAMYDRAMGEKFELKKVLGTVDAINPFMGENSITKRLYSDLKEIEQASLEDSKKALDARRVVRLSQGETETSSNRFGININLYLLKLRNRTTHSDGFVSFYDVDNQNQKFAIKTISTQKEFKAFELWGQEDTQNLAMLVKTDDNYNLLSSAGLQSIRAKEELTLTRDEVRGLRNRLQRLPEDIKSLLNLPDPEKLTGDISRARIEQSIFLDTQNLESQASITPESAAAELKELIKNWGDLDEEPLGASSFTSGDEQDPKMKALEDGRLYNYWAKKALEKSKKAKTPEKAAELKQEALDYAAKADAEFLDAYSIELVEIPLLLGGMFGKDRIAHKVKYHERLQTIPLFKELGMTLVLNLISKADKAGLSTVKMKDVVSYRLSITGRGIEPKITEYPATEQNTDGTQIISENKRKSEIFQRILNDNAYLTDRSFNLRYYMDDKGNSLSLKEVYERSKSH